MRDVPAPFKPGLDLKEASGEVRMRRIANARSLLFFAILAAVALWIGSGVLLRAVPPAAVPVERRPIVVAASWSEAEPVERILSLYGEVVPNQVVRVRAQTAGQVAVVAVDRGAGVAPGQELARLDLADRPARERQALAQVATAQRDYNAAAELAGQGIAPRAREEATLAELEAARSRLETIRQEIANTIIRAPIRGVVNRLLAEAGDYVAVGGDVAEIVDNQPLRAVVQVPQHAISRVRPGASARVSLIGQAHVPGTVQFVSSLAEAATRTFRVEVMVPNPDGSLPSGVSAEVVIPTATVMAHRISPAMTSLDDRGVLGLNAVDDDDIVVFHEIELVRVQSDAVWVTGLPGRVRLITIRPGVVAAGQRVEVRETPPEYGYPGAMDRRR